VSAPIIPQVAIACLGVTAIFLTQSHNERVRRWACIVGISGQPFWFWATYSAEQWGIFGLTFLYASAWGKGVWMHWIKPWRSHARV
jgi:hypothetical protein